MNEILSVETRLLTAEEAAQYLSVSPKSLETWRTRGGGPRFVRLRSRAIRYRLNDLTEFVEQGVRASTSDPGGTVRHLALRQMPQRA